MKDCSGNIFTQKFSVDYEYSVCFTRNVFDQDNPVLRTVAEKLSDGASRRTLVYVDDGVIEAVPELSRKIEEYLNANKDIFELQREPENVLGGERTKNGWNAVQDVMTSIGKNHLCRHSFVIAVGGGSVLDMVGFAASLVHRGVRLIRIPTSVLAQDDGGVGVKNGMDEHGLKNFVGTFAPPAAVINDFDFLKTLDDKYWFGGISEAVKVAVIKDKGFFDFLYNNSSKLADRDEDAIEHVVRQSAFLHLDHISTNGDPFEFGTARPLDFGHWAAHKLEVLSDYRIGHGQAVSMGIAMDSYYAAEKGLITADERDSIIRALKSIGLPIWDDLMESVASDGQLELLKGLEDFREHLGGTLTITLPNGIGKKIEVHEMDADIIQAGIIYLKNENI